MIPAIEHYQGLNVTLQVTEDCNMACKYCYEVNKRPNRLDFDRARRFIDMLLEDPDPTGIRGTEMEWILQHGIIIDFIGGDALMEPELCDEVLQYFQYRAYELNHRWKNRWRSSISTNGTLLGKQRVRDFLWKYRSNMSLGISVDGCPELHDKNRIMKDGSPSMERILENWDFYMEYAGDGASTKSTLNRDSIPYIAESIKFLHENLGLKYINMNFIFEDMGLVEEDYIEIDRQLGMVVDYIYEHRHDMHLNMLDENFGIGKPYDPASEHKNWCGAGTMPCLAVNGRIYPCFRFSPNTLYDRDRDLPVGDIWNGFNRKDNFELVRAQTREKISSDKCKQCQIETSCAWCIGGAFSETGSFHRQTYICRIKKLIDKHARRYWNRYYGYQKYEESSYLDEVGL